LRTGRPDGGTVPGKAEGASLLEFVKGFAEEETLSIEEDLGHGYVRLKITEAEKRQAMQDIRRAEDVVLELARNARDAGAANILVATRKLGGRWRHFTVIDDGVGIPLDVQPRIFESRVTSKSKGVLEDRFGVHGRGMALFSIRQVVRSVELFRSEEGRGSIFRAVVDLEVLPERSDQYTAPEVVETSEGLTVKGPRNIMRSLLEVGLGQELSIYLGSPSQVLSTLCLLSREAAHSSTAKEGRGVPLWTGIHNQRDGSRLSKFSREELGLEVSQRNALRVIEGIIEPLRPLSTSFEEDGLDRYPGGIGGPGRPSGERSLGRRIGSADLDFLGKAVTRECNEVGRRYFLEVSECRVRRTGSGLSITVVFEESV